MKKKSNQFTFLWLILCALLGTSEIVLANGTNQSSVISGEYPKFESYPATVLQPKITPGLVFATRLSKRFRTVISDESKKPVNFSGYFRVVTWGCGTDCRGFAIVNKKNGMIYTMPGVEYVVGVMGNGEDRISFRPDSRLFIVTGNMNDDESTEGKYFYVWTGEKMKLLFKFPISKENILN